MLDKLFVLVPLVALLCNVFLFLTIATAKKNKLVIAFLLVLCSMTAWTLGSLCMRLALYPGVRFWFEVSLMGIFSVPIVYYNFIHSYTNQRGNFAKRCWMAIWAVILILNLFDVFIQHPMVNASSGERNFEVTMSPLVIIPLVVAVFTLVAAGRMVVRGVRKDGIPAHHFVPMAIGVALMFLGNMSDLIPGAVALPLDTLACAINAILLYYLLYKKRIITLEHLMAGAPTYWVATVLTALVLGFSLRTLENFYATYFSAYMEVKTTVFVVVFSLLTLILFAVIRKLMNNLFVMTRGAREVEIKLLSNAVGQTLDLEEILRLYSEFLQANFPGNVAYICLLEGKSDQYAFKACTQPMQQLSFALSRDNPLVEWLTRNRQGIRYAEYQRTGHYRSMWETEKDLLGSLGVEYVLPMLDSERLIGITLFISRGRGKDLSQSEVSLIESAAAILSIAFKNASLYYDMQYKAERDSLTELYNRRYFNERLEADFKRARSETLALTIYNFDNFRLYNELHGSEEGDRMLQRFARILSAAVGQRGTVARLGGKEFAVSMPFCDVRAAHQCALDVKGWLERDLQADEDSMRKYLTFSAGISAYPMAAANVEELMTYATMAVYTAKKKGKGHIAVYGEGRQLAEHELGASEKRKIGEEVTPTILALTAAIDAKDHYTFNHSNNVSEYARELAKTIGLDAEHVEIIRQAGLLHDIGKIGIPEAILSKASALTFEEAEVMKQHVEGSIAMIRYLPSLDYVIPSAIGHHERWDGKGYPRGLSGEQIPIGARCLCLADAFDAMISKRPYRDPLPVEVACGEIQKNLGTQFDPVLGATFIELVRSGRMEAANKPAWAARG